MNQQPKIESRHNARTSPKRNLTDSTSDVQRLTADARACQLVLAGKLTVDDAVACKSTSERIVLALAFGRQDLLPPQYDDFRAAWRRLDNRQRKLVDAAAKAWWEGYAEGSPC